MGIFKGLLGIILASAACGCGYNSGVTFLYFQGPHGEPAPVLNGGDPNTPQLRSMVAEVYKDDSGKERTVVEDFEARRIGNGVPSRYELNYGFRDTNKNGKREKNEPLQLLLTPCEVGIHYQKTISAEQQNPELNQTPQTKTLPYNVPEKPATPPTPSTTEKANTTKQPKTGMLVALPPTDSLQPPQSIEPYPLLEKANEIGPTAPLP